MKIGDRAPHLTSARLVDPSLDELGVKVDARRGRLSAGALLREARPRQWSKNLLVFAAPGAAGVLHSPRSLTQALLAFVAFCLASSSTYYWNDLRDREADRLHPKKRRRPIAAGEIPAGLAHVIAGLLAVLAIATAAATGNRAAVVVIATYVVVTLLYSHVLKHVEIFDLVIVAGCFLLRAIGGAAATAVPMSGWFVLCVSFGSLFIVTGKRLAELRDLGPSASDTRATLACYSSEFLRLVLGIAAAATLVAYCLWAFEGRETSTGSIPYFELSIAPMVTAFLRYALILDRSGGAAPEEVFLNDRTIQMLGAVWLVVYAAAVYTS